MEERGLLLAVVAGEEGAAGDGITEHVVPVYGYRV
jgi:hypothetical protein